MADMSDKISIGIVTEALPNATFRVRMDDASPLRQGSSEASEIIAYLSGKMRLHRIKVLVGDKVKIEMSEYGKTKGRIVHRM